jgi:hypothetical protein
MTGQDTFLVLLRTVADPLADEWRALSPDGAQHGQSQYCRIAPSQDQARLRCAPPHGAARAALWLEAPRARERQIDAACRLSRWLIPAPRLSGVARNPSRALRVATRWPAATLDRTRPRVAGHWQLQGMRPPGSRCVCLTGTATSCSGSELEDQNTEVLVHPLLLVRVAAPGLLR